MKEKDIIDLTKLKEDESGELVDENGEEVGCLICHTHDKAYQKLSTSQEVQIKIPRCPKCGSLMTLGYAGYDAAVVSESNSSTPEGEIGYYPIFKCTNCKDDDEKVYALIPERVRYNGNHDIFYTGGKDYLFDEEHIKLCNSIFDELKPSIEQFVRRVVKKHESLTIDNLKTWCKYDIEHTIATWLYEHDLKR